MEPVLEVRGLRAGYTRGGVLGKKETTEVLHGLEFTLMPGEILGLVGESGCGKSTLSKALLGLIPATAGEIRHGSQAPQMVFQDPLGSLNPAHSVGWLLEESLKLAGVRDKAARQEACRQVLALVGLEEKYLRRRPRALSGGQCQRAALALCLIRKPRLIIADEPVSALDVTIQAQILALLLSLREQLGLSYLFISHDMDVIYQVCDRVMVMKDGCIVEQGTRDEVFFHPQHPYTRQLLAASAGEL